MINTADKILCDVPCSGLGIIGRKPEIKWNRAEDNDLPKIQRQILDNASKYLKINGEIVYSTCTIEKKKKMRLLQTALRRITKILKKYLKRHFIRI